MYENTQKRNNIKGPSITWSYIWHIDIFNLRTYLLDTHSVKVVPNAVHFRDIFFRHRADDRQKMTDDRPQMTERIPELPTDSHLLNLSETCLNWSILVWKLFLGNGKKLST